MLQDHDAPNAPIADERPVDIADHGPTGGVPLGSADDRLWRRALMLLGLSALAIAQPLLDLFGRNAEFFVAGNYGTWKIVLFAIIVAFGPAAFATAVTAVAASIDPRLGTFVFRSCIAILGAMFALVLLRSFGLANPLLVFSSAVALSALITGLVIRAVWARMLLVYLSASAVAFAGLFLFASPASDLILASSGGKVGPVAMAPLQGPVVVIVLDELPTATLMTADGSLNSERYPGFAELGSVSTWFRNASSRDQLTSRSVPSIMNGLVDDATKLPTAAAHPRTLLSLLGRDVDVHRYESVTDLCPASVCEPLPPQPLQHAMQDAAVVYGHRVLPPTIADGLASIDNSWGSFGEFGNGGTPSTRQEVLSESYSKWHAVNASEASPRGQASILRDYGEAISGEPAVHFVHVAMPHHPWTLSGSGAGLSDWPESVEDPDEVTDEYGARLEYQLHAMQVGAADAVLSEILERLRSLPEWDDTLLVVMSDHGMNFTLPDLGRTKITDENAEEVYRIPLFIKAPGQATGQVIDEPAQTIDVLPSIIDLLDVDVDWEFDGHSLYDGSESTVEPKVSTDVDELFAIVQRRAVDFPHGDDWLALAAVGENGDLVGHRVDDYEVSSASSYAASVDQSDLFDDLPTSSGALPLVLFGHVTNSAGAATRPASELLVAINGRIAGVLGGYEPNGDGWDVSGYVADLYRDGANDVEVYEVSRRGGSVELRPVD